MLSTPGPLTMRILAAKEAYLAQVGRYPTGIRMCCATFDKLRKDLPDWANNVNSQGRPDSGCRDLIRLKDFFDIRGGKEFVCGMELELTDLPRASA